MPSFSEHVLSTTPRGTYSRTSRLPSRLVNSLAGRIACLQTGRPFKADVVHTTSLDPERWIFPRVERSPTTEVTFASWWNIHPLSKQTLLIGNRYHRKQAQYSKLRTPFETRENMNERVIVIRNVQWQTSNFRIRSEQR